jgi:hypothetical protein
MYPHKEAGEGGEAAQQSEQTASGSSKKDNVVDARL